MLIEIMCISGILTLILMGGVSGEDIRTDVDTSTKIGCGVQEPPVSGPENMGIESLKNLSENMTEIIWEAHMPVHKEMIGAFLYGKIIEAFSFRWTAQLLLLKYYILL